MAMAMRAFGLLLPEVRIDHSAPCWYAAAVRRYGLKLEPLLSAPEQTTRWRVVHPNKRYFQIVDSTGRRICDFFPEAPGSPPREELLAIAERFAQRENDHATT
jgi:hypothetical protein